ncbi:MAG: hypothetical protein R3C28_31970 [Pirellulaceae bacterium]
MRILPTVFVVFSAAWQATSAQNLSREFQNVISDPLLIKAFYQPPNRLVGTVSSTGAVSVNADWEAGTAEKWFIEQQRGAEQIYCKRASWCATQSLFGKPC